MLKSSMIWSEAGEMRNLTSRVLLEEKKATFNDPQLV